LAGHLFDHLTSLLFTGGIAEGRAHFDRAIALYDPAKHRPLATRFGVDVRAAVLSNRSWPLWMLGYPKAALANADHALKDAREIAQAATLMFALARASLIHILCGNYAAANAEADELVALADEKRALFWKADGAEGTMTSQNLSSKDFRRQLEGYGDLCSARHGSILRAGPLKLRSKLIIKTN
jgi:tetratricopeptide (TPR) repeat protein